MAVATTSVEMLEKSERKIVLEVTVSHVNLWKQMLNQCYNPNSYFKYFKMYLLPGKHYVVKDINMTPKLKIVLNDHCLKCFLSRRHLHLSVWVERVSKVQTVELRRTCAHIL